MFIHFLVAIAVVCMAGAAVAFVLYGRARMQEQEQREQLFLRIHYACLLLVFLAGMLYMFVMVNKGA